MCNIVVRGKGSVVGQGIEANSCGGKTTTSANGDYQVVNMSTGALQDYTHAS